MEFPGRAGWLMFAAGAAASGLAAWRAAHRRFAANMRDLERDQAELARSLEDAKTGLAQERARLQTLVEKLPDGLIMTNMRGEVIYFNAPAMPLVGAGEADVRPGGRALFSPLDADKWRMPVQAILKSHSSGRPFETRGADGAAASHRTTVTVFNDAATGDFGVLIMLRDVTAERRLDGLKEEFFQSAAHDLHAPLFAIQGYLRLLRRSLALGERQAAWFDSIDQSCDKLTLFVKDALDFARIESGHLLLVPTSFDARALARRTVSLFKALADERGIALEARFEPDAPCSIEADERLFERLLHNLVANALKFAPRGGHVTLAAAADAGQLEIGVEDDGPGVPESQRAEIFERFRQLESSGPKSGFGLGLSICAKIVKLHRGVIWVEPGRVSGSRFVVRLPLTQRAKEAA